MAKKNAPKVNLDITKLKDELQEKTEELRRATVIERRYLTQDATVEKLGELLRDNPRGLLVLRDELAGWVRTMDKPGREGDREFYLEAWNGTGSYTFDRIGRGTIHIPALTISIVGGIQPGKLSAYVSEAVEGGEGADGLLQRLQVLVWPDRLGEWGSPERWPDTEAKNRAFTIFEHLDNLGPASLGVECEPGEIPALRFAPDAQELWDEWRAELENRLRSSELASSPALESHLSKYRSLLPSLALLFHLIAMVAETLDDGGAKSNKSPFGTSVTEVLDLSGENDASVDWSEVSLEAAKQAAAWCEFLEAHARKVYAVELNPGVEEAHALAAKIKEGALGHGDSVRDIYRHHWQGLRTPAQVERALGVLKKAGWVRVYTTDTGGRPTDVLRLHPDLRGEQDG